jgi:hypothetical protein
LLYFVQYDSIYRDKKVVGVFVAISCAASAALFNNYISNSSSYKTQL